MARIIQSNTTKLYSYAISLIALRGSDVVLPNKLFMMVRQTLPVCHMQTMASTSNFPVIVLTEDAVPGAKLNLGSASKDHAIRYFVRVLAVQQCFVCLTIRDSRQTA